VAAVCAFRPASAAEWYVQPSAAVGVEGDTNLDLLPGEKTRTEGNIASVSSIFGIATPDWDTTIRPRVEYRYYPEDIPDDRLEAYLDFNTTYRGQRSTASLYGTFEHRDDFGAEFSPAIYDTINPVQPTNPNTGKAVQGETRNSVYVVPQYVYQYTPLFGLGVSGIYQKIDYSPSGPGYNVDFDYELGKVFGRWSLGPRSDLSVGAFGAHYEASEIDSTATGSGGSIDFDTRWSPLFTTNAQAIYERVTLSQQLYSTNTVTVNGTPQTTGVLPAGFLHNGTNGWGVTVGGVYQNQLDTVRLNGGRLITPSGAGALYVADQIRAQYERKLTFRLTGIVAAIGVRNRGLSANVVNDDRSYAQTDFEMKWMISPTWFIDGGYQYMWEKYAYYTSGAANNEVYVKLTYKGLGPQR
jgi:hypothetical protein